MDTSKTHKKNQLNNLRQRKVIRGGTLRQPVDDQIRQT